MDTSEPTPASPGDDLDPSATKQKLRNRLQMVLAAAVVALAAFSAGDLTLQGPRYPVLFILQLTQVAVIFVVVRVLRTSHSDRGIMAMGVGAFTIIYLTGASIGAISGQSSMIALFFCALALTTAATLPWGLRPQLATVSVAGLALLAVIYTLSGDDISETYRFGNIMLIGAVLLGSVVVAHQLQQYRERTGREHRLLLTAQERIRRYYGELVVRVAERTAALERTNRELQSFGYSVSHDLRSPLRVVSSFTQILLEDYGNILDQSGMEHVARVRVATDRMGKIIDGLLELAGLAKTELTPEKIDLSEIVREAAAELQAAYPDHQVEVIVEDDVQTVASAALMALAISNLLENAWKFTRGAEPAKVEFGVTDVGGHPAYFIRDNGMGFEATQAEEIFVAFKRLRPDDGIDGSGIGLATVERIIQRHGGKVWAESKPGQGATFYFSF